VTVSLVARRRFTAKIDATIWFDDARQEALLDRDFAVNRERIRAVSYELAKAARRPAAQNPAPSFQWSS
jgi:hypothetical protein